MWAANGDTNPLPLLRKVEQKLKRNKSNRPKEFQNIYNIQCYRWTCHI
jgi:hypothetical protein